MPEPTDQHETFIALLSKHEPVLRAHIRSTIHRPEDVDEVMQAVSIAAWRKFDTLTDTAAFPQWATVIARYEILKFRRSKARDRFVLSQDIIERLLDEAPDELTNNRKRLDFLEACLAKLPKNQRDLILLAYQPGFSIQNLAKEMGLSRDALYQKLRRIRLTLMHCIEDNFSKA